MSKTSTKEMIEKWKKQTGTRYKDLSEGEKKSDRYWAKRVIDVWESQT